MGIYHINIGRGGCSESKEHDTTLRIINMKTMSVFNSGRSESAAKTGSPIRLIQIIRNVIQDKILHPGHKE